MTRLNNKTILITGAAGGIGQAIAHKCHAEGAQVILTDINLAHAQKVAGELSDATAYQLDVSSATDAEKLRAELAGARVPVDVLINNAGFDLMGPFLSTDETDWHKIININLFGVLNCAKAFVPGMIEQGCGRIVNIASDAGRVGSSGEAVYSAAKGGIIAFTKTLAREVARNNIGVNCVSPGPTDTPMFAELSADLPKLGDALKRAIPLRRLGEPIDIANAVAFLASDEASYITGQTLSVSGGLTMA